MRLKTNEIITSMDCKNNYSLIKCNKLSMGGRSMEYRYRPEGVCSREMIFEIENGIIKSLKIVGGCDGNTKGISKLVVGMKIEDVIEKLKGINCGNKGTSCPDQLSKALEKYIKAEA